MVEKREKYIKYIKRILPLFFVLVWMVVIFVFSSSPAAESSQQSTLVYERLSKVSFLKLLFSFIPVRKCAHMFLYFILELFLFLYLKGKTKHPYIISLLCTYLYSISDEIHQLFVDGRGGLFMDTLYDISGAFIACLLLSLILHMPFVRHKNF